jgi:hypothetical protein
MLNDGKVTQEERDAFDIAIGLYQNPDGDWREDREHENGCYTCVCGTCGNQFTGHKRRVTCKGCSVVGHKTLTRPDGSRYHEPMTYREAAARVTGFDSALRDQAGGDG